MYFRIQTKKFLRSPFFSCTVSVSESRYAASRSNKHSLSQIRCDSYNFTSRQTSLWPHGTLCGARKEALAIVRKCSTDTRYKNQWYSAVSRSDALEHLNTWALDSEGSEWLSEWWVEQLHGLTLIWWNRLIVRTFTFTEPFVNGEELFVLLMKTIKLGLLLEKFDTIVAYR